MNNDEKVVAVIEPLKAAGEAELAGQVTAIEATAESMLVLNDEQYQGAGEFGVMLRQKMAEVVSFFAPMKKAAHDAHKQICDREKQMLTPLKTAEATLKQYMSDYVQKKDAERRAAEEAARRLAQEEAERKMAQAIEAEKNGDAEAAGIAFADAAIADSSSRSIVVDAEKPKASGVTVTKDWEIDQIDLSKVPDEINGAVIRPVDTAAVMRLIRASKGGIKIDGIAYHEVAKTSFRRS